jgi:LacI family transcriptional regulator
LHYNFYIYFTRIKNFHYKMIKRHITIHDIARELNINASTVSRALNDHPRISDATKRLVLDTATRLNYKPNSLASNLRKGAGNTLGIIIPVINRYFFANIIHGIESITNAAGFNLIICQSDENIEKEISSIQTLVKNRVDGILISISAETRNANHFDPAVKTGIPIVQFDRAIESFNSSKILNDDFTGAYQSVTHLIKQGYSNIVHFSGPLYIQLYEKRFLGYKQALEDNHIPFNKNLVFESVINREKGHELMKLILASDLKADALFAASDLSALGALLLLKEKGVAVPQQFGVAGYVNEPFTEFIEPSLTTTEQYGVEIGRTAAQVIVEEINSNNKLAARTIIINPRLIIRNSTMHYTAGNE